MVGRRAVYLRSAGSRSCFRLVAAITTTPLLLSNPSSCKAGAAAGHSRGGLEAAVAETHHKQHVGYCTALLLEDSTVVPCHVSPKKCSAVALWCADHLAHSGTPDERVRSAWTQRCTSLRRTERMRRVASCMSLSRAMARASSCKHAAQGPPRAQHRAHPARRVRGGRARVEIGASRGSQRGSRICLGVERSPLRA